MTNIYCSYPFGVCAHLRIQQFIFGWLAKKRKTKQPLRTIVVHSALSTYVLAMIAMVFMCVCCVCCVRVCCVRLQSGVCCGQCFASKREKVFGGVVEGGYWGLYAKETLSRFVSIGVVLENDSPCSGTGVHFGFFSLCYSRIFLYYFRFCCDWTDGLFGVSLENDRVLFVVARWTLKHHALKDIVIK